MSAAVPVRRLKDPTAEQPFPPAVGEAGEAAAGAADNLRALLLRDRIGFAGEVGDAGEI